MLKITCTFLALSILFCQAVLGDLITVDGSRLEVSKASQLRLKPAMEKLQEGNLEDCRRLAAEVVAELKDLPHADVLVAIWLFEKREFQAGQQLLERLSQTESSRPDVHFAFAEFARGSGRAFDAWMHLSAAEQTKAPSSWSKKYADEFFKTVLYTKSLVAEQRDDWNASSHLLTRLRASGVNTVSVELGLGRAAFHNGEIQVAESHFRTAASLAPDEVAPELQLAGLFAAKRKSEKADEWFVKGEVENQKHADRIRLAHAVWLLSEQRAPDAFRLAQSALKEETKFKDEFSLVQALVYYTCGKFTEAEALLSSLAQKNIGSLRISNQLALTLVESTDEGKRARALQIAFQNMKSSQDSADIACSLAWIQFRLGDMQAAEETTSAIIRRGGQFSRDSAYFLSQILLRLDRKKEADSLLEVTNKSKGEFFNAKRLANSNAFQSE